MQAHPDDHIARARRPNLLPWAILLVLLAAGGYYWQFHAAPAVSISTAPAPPPRIIQPISPPEAAPATPVAAEPPLPPPATPTEVAATEPPAQTPTDAPPLPPLDDSDTAIRTEASSLTDAALANALASQWQGDNLLRRFVAFVANLAEGKLDAKTSPVAPPKGRFAVSPNVPLQMTPASQARFDTLVHIITRIDPARCAASYQRHYPLLHAAYAELGEKKTFHSVMLTAIDKLLATPEPATEPELVPAEKGLYRYASPALEALPAAQKPMIRMGRENARELKSWLRQVRAAILTTPD